MPERLRTSSRAEDILSEAGRLSQADFSALARAALAWSLRTNGRAVQRSVDVSGRAIRFVSLFGKDHGVFLGCVGLVYGEYLSADSDAFAQAIKDHVDAGCEMLANCVKDCGGRRSGFWRRLLEELPDAGRSEDVCHPLAVLLGYADGGREPVIAHLNDTAKHANPHTAIVGKPGTGKTQLLLKILADVRVQSSFATNFVLFDYKGDVAANQRFIDVTRASVFRLPQDTLPLNPLHLPEAGERQVQIAAEEKAESLACIDSHIGPVQRGVLVECIRESYRRAADSAALGEPDLALLYDVLRGHYASQSKAADTLHEVCRRLAEFRLFWQAGSGREVFGNLLEKTLVIDLHGLPVLRELVAYLVIEMIYREMCQMGDSSIAENRRQIRTALVIDEAHNYLGHRNRFLEGTIREGRSKGVAVLLSSQSPDDFSPRGFDYRELIELLIAFQCEGASPVALQNLLGCTARTATVLATSLANLPPGEALTKGALVGKEFCRFRSEPFHRAYV